MRRVSSHCSSFTKEGLEQQVREKRIVGFGSAGEQITPQGNPRLSPTTHLFSGSRSQQRTVMGKKLGGQFGGQ